MSVNRGVMVIGQDMALTGEIRNGKLVEVHGVLDGYIASESVVVHPTGRVIGTLRADSAKVNGTLEGTVQVKNLIEIGSTGRVVG
ncbi:MAG TPA: polymer-forming cytoskeletal protein, partial [Hyphomicrobiaceae bacterium]|nr:polymer-forming cytoskeletal protein [Hyphomicrobiaceae bacterium]